MTIIYPEEPLDPLYPTTDTDFLPAASTTITSAQVVPLVAYEHPQSSAASIWTITHNLNFFPNVTVLGSACLSFEKPTANRVRSPNFGHCVSILRKPYVQSVFDEH
jgi:hypothetical protein